MERDGTGEGEVPSSLASLVIPFDKNAIHDAPLSPGVVVQRQFGLKAPILAVQVVGDARSAVHAEAFEKNVAART